MKTNPLVFVLFGSTGDLARLKLLPALHDMWKENITPPKLNLILVGRREMTTDEYFEEISSAQPHPFTDKVTYLNPEYVSVDFNNADGFTPLWQKLQEFEGSEILYYMSVGPEVLNLCVDRLEDESSKQMMAGRKASIVAEKPFGSSLEDAMQLNKRLGAMFEHPYVYRNDHYLNKDTIQAVMNLKENNLYIKDVLCGEDVEEIQLTVTEEVDLGSRVSYFEGRGMSIDWFQSHMLQIMATFCADEGEEDYCRAKADFIDSLQIVPGSIIKAQYSSYRSASDVPEDSNTETLLGVQYTSTLPKWENTVFKFIAGKAMDKKEVSLNVKLRREHTKLGEEFKVLIDPPGSNPLLQNKSVKDEFEETIMNAYHNRTSAFVSVAAVEAQWRVTQQLLDKLEGMPVEFYPHGTSYSDFCNPKSKWC